MNFENYYKHNCKGCWNDECKFYQPTEDEEIAKLIEERETNKMMALVTHQKM